MRLSLLCLLLTFSYVISQGFNYKIDPTTQDNTSQTFSDPSSNPSSCTCDLQVELCDTFCCCDSKCSSENINKWTSASVCSKTSTTSTSRIIHCKDRSIYDQNSYQSLNCIYFDNSNTIGEYFTSTSTEPPVVNKMGELMFSASLNKRDSTNTIYLPGLPVYYNSSPTPSNIMIPQPFGTTCKQQQLIFGKNSSFNCLQTANNQNCETSVLYTLPNICGNGTSNCSIPVDKTNLNCPAPGNINQFTMNVYITGNGSYLITRISIQGKTNSITTETYNLQGNINFIIQNSAGVTFKSGAPGYLPGLPLTFYNSAFQPVTINLNINNATDNICKVKGPNSASDSIKFLTSINKYCILPSITTNYQVNNLFQTDTVQYISRYGDSSRNNNTSGMVPIYYANKTNPSPRTTTLNILYSIAGSSLDYQYYLLSGYVEYTDYTDLSATNQPAYFNVKWVYVDPASVTRAPTNNFYLYFSKLWNPIQNTYNRLLFEPVLIAGVALSLTLLF